MYTTTAQTKQIRYSFRCPRCKTVQATDYTQQQGGFYTTWRTLDGKDQFFQDDLPCTTCGRERHANPVKGRPSNKKCDARCTGATGHNCECQCGGKNHGADYL